MALSRFVGPFFDVGKGIRPSSGAQLFFFSTGTAVPKDTFNCPDGTTANSNPVIADSQGVFPDIFWEGTFKVILKDNKDVQIWEADPVSSVIEFAQSSSSFIFHDDLAGAKSRTDIVEGSQIEISDRNNSKWVYVTGATPNPFSIIAHDTLPLQLENIVENSEINILDYGVTSSSTQSETRDALDHAISVIDEDGGGIVIVASVLQYGYNRSDPTTAPDMTANLNNCQVIDYSIGNSTAVPGFDDGSQTRIFYHTPDVFLGQSDGNGTWTTARYHPYHSINNNANLAPPGDPSRTANDNRRCTNFYMSDGVAKWGMGMGGNSGANLTDDELSDFRGIIGDIPDLGVTGILKWLQVSKLTSAVAFNTNVMSKTTPYEFTIRAGFASGACVFRGSDLNPFLRLIGLSGEVSLRRNTTGLELRIDEENCYTVGVDGKLHKFISTNGNLEHLYEAQATSRRFALNNATSELRWQATNLSTNTMVHTDGGNLTITGVYAPFTGVHLFFSVNEIATGLAVDLIDSNITTVEIEENTHSMNGTVVLSGKLSKVCAGVVEEQIAIEGGYLTTVAACGDNRTANLNGFKVNDENGTIEAGDILVTSSTPGELMRSGAGLSESIVRFKAMVAPDENNLVYGYFK